MKRLINSKTTRVWTMSWRKCDVCQYEFKFCVMWKTPKSHRIDLYNGPGYKYHCRDCNAV